MEPLTFVPNGSLVQCLNVSIERDLVLEEPVEPFRVVIDSTQADPAVVLGANSTSIIYILDEEGGK